MIENAENRQVKLDPTFIKSKNNLQKEIEKMEEKNRGLLLELSNSNNEIVKLNDELYNFRQAKKEEIIRTQGLNVLFKNSSIIDEKNHMENFRTRGFFLLASTLDLLMGALPTFIYDARKSILQNMLNQNHNQL
ncbi:hypothetical protein [Borreliella bavariensis]|uniref:hypothetical protein n=1 Tax=Borreliella bavariensis TaxID=664662 RepID=UPI001C007348|nr:hypothetical protein [Borreliella bavariensis]